MKEKVYFTESSLIKGKMEKNCVINVLRVLDAEKRGLF
jgi:hypothetical protein